MSPRIPILNRGVDVYSLPLSTKEGFVLSRIDDVSTVEDISIMVGVKLTDLLAMLDRLADLGAVKLAWRPVPNPKPAANNNHHKPTAARTAPARPATGDLQQSAATLPKGLDNAAVQRLLAVRGPQQFTEAELTEAGDLSYDQKYRLLTVFYALDGKNYYQQLGVDQDVDKKVIKAAYFELSRLFHPDSSFGKDLGTFKAKMETVFKRLTEAYDVLGRNQRRKEYDEYLASTQATSVMQTTLDHVDRQVRALSTAPPAEREPVAVEKSVPPPPPPAAPASADHQPRRDIREVNDYRAPAPRESHVHVRPPASAEERKVQARERLRRNLGSPGSSSVAGSGPHGMPQPPAAGGTRSDPPPPVAQVTSAASAGAPARDERRDSALKGLRSTLRQSGSGAGGAEPVLAHLRRARDAEQKGDMLGAAAALQAALTLQPNHKDLQAQYERVSRAVSRNLADNYEKQARYEEKQGKWAAAAASWERVSEARPEDPIAARSVTDALLKVSGDLHKAQRYAQRAVDAAPQDPANVVALARVFLAAGLRVNARRELEKAVKLDPQNEMIKNLLREAR